MEMKIRNVKVGDIFNIIINDKNEQFITLELPIHDTDIFSEYVNIKCINSKGQTTNVFSHENTNIILLNHNMTELQKQIIVILATDYTHLTCDDIAWELKKHKMNIGNSVKSLVKKGMLESYIPSIGGNPKYFYRF